MLRWALWSRGNALIMVGSFFLTLILLSVSMSLIPTDETPGTVASSARTRWTPQPTRAPAAPAPSSAHPSSAPPPRATPDVETTDAAHDDTVNARTRDAIRERARRFTRAWLDTGKGWEKGLRKHVTPGLMPALAMTNEARIPDTALARVIIADATPFNATARVELANKTALVLGLTWDGRAWQVATLEPEEAA